MTRHWWMGEHLKMTIDKTEADTVIEQLLKEEKPAPKKEIKKQAAKETPKQKQYFDVKLEVLLPATLTYRVLALDTEEAIAETAKRAPDSLKPKYAAKKLLKASVYASGTSLIKAIKNFNAMIVFYILDLETNGILNQHEITEFSAIRSTDLMQLTRQVRVSRPDDSSLDALRITGKTKADLLNGISKSDLADVVDEFFTARWIKSRK